MYETFRKKEAFLEPFENFIFIYISQERYKSVSLLNYHFAKKNLQMSGLSTRKKTECSDFSFIHFQIKTLCPQPSNSIQTFIQLSVQISLLVYDF